MHAANSGVGRPSWAMSAVGLQEDASARVAGEAAAVSRLEASLGNGGEGHGSCGRDCRLCREASSASGAATPPRSAGSVRELAMASGGASRGL